MSALVARPRVDALLDSLAERRLVVVLGDAASGKTTAVRQWLAGRGEPHGWVSAACDPGGPVGPGDTSARTPRQLLHALVAATSPLCPGLAGQLSLELDAGRASNAATDASADVGAVLAGALAAGWADTAATPFTVVLDDVSELDADCGGREFVADLVRLHPRSVRTLLLARTAPPFATRRLDAAGEYGELGPRALRFDAGETASLFAASGVRLDDAAARIVTDACGGWAGGLRLAVEAALTRGIDGRDGTGAVADHLAQSAAPALLADVALRTLDDASRRTIRALAVLGRVERAVTATRPDATARLDALADRGLLVAGDATGWSLTALARYATEVESSTEPDAPGYTAGVLAETVEMALAADRPEPALRWAARHGDPALVRRTLERAGLALLDAGSDTLIAAAERLPVPVGDAGIDSVLACHFANRGDIDRATTHLHAVDATSGHPPELAWRIAAALWLHGDVAAAQEATDRSRPTVAGSADAAQLSAIRAALAWGRGDDDLARTTADDALREAKTSRDDAALAAAWVAQAFVAAMSGDLTRNARCYATALDCARRGHDVLTQLRVHCNVGSHYTETGRFREALDELAVAVRLGEATGQRSRTALARLNQGQAKLGLGLLDEALLDAEYALGLWSELHSPMAAYAQQLRGEVLARRGDRTRAVTAFRAAVEEAEQQRDAQTLAPATGWLARCVALDDPDEADRLARRAIDQPAALGTLPAVLALGWVALGRDDPATAADCAERAREQAGKRDDPAALAQALLLSLLSDGDRTATDARLLEARALLDEIGDRVGLAELDVVAASLGGNRRAAAAARATLRALGVRDSADFVAGPLAVLHARDDPSAGTITVRLLGGFAVELGGGSESAVVPPSAWQSRKARDLVKIIASRRGKPIPRDALAELLWPEAADSSGNRLSVALSTARSVFDPAKERPADHVVVADRDAVRLNTATVALDVDEYLSLSETALAAPVSTAVPLLEAAAAAYAGDLCEEDPYEAWAQQPREELRARQQQVLSSLADLLLGRRRFDDAVPRLLALLALDDYDERTHLRLVAALVHSGRHGEARRAYRRYVERMAEIDVEPAAFPQGSRSQGERFPKGSAQTLPG